MRRGKEMKKRLVIILLITLLLMGVLGPQTVFAQREYKEVEVPAIWYPIDKDTNEVYEDLTPLITHPDAFERSEVAELIDEEYYITYMGTPSPQGGTSWTANNFMYTGNLWFSNRFHRVVAQAYSTYTPGIGTTSSVKKLVYGDFADENYVEGLHGMGQTAYQEGETLKLYIATGRDNVSLSEAEFVKEELTIQRPKDRSLLINLLEKNILEYNYLDLDLLEDTFNVKYITIENNDLALDRAYLYKYRSADRSIGDYLKDNGGQYLNIIDDLNVDELELGEYEVVIPIYWQRMIPYNLSNPQTFSRNRYKIDDSIHFTLVVEERDGADVVVSYVDEEGENLLNEVKLSGKYGEAWTSEVKEIEGWTLKSSPENSEGTFTDEVQEVIYVYEKVVIIEDEDPPLGPGEKEPEDKEPEEKEPTEIIEDEETPIGPAKLPKTGEVSSGLFLLMGAIVVTTGVVVRKKKA